MRASSFTRVGLYLPTHRFVLLVAIGAIYLTSSAAVRADEPPARPQSKLAPGQFDARYAEFPFGGDLDAVMAWVEKDTLTRYREGMSNTHDQAERDRMLAEAKARVRAVRDSYLKFEGQQTGYNISVIAGDFAHRTGESMLVATVGRTREHYFFIRGKAYKILRTDGSQPEFPVLLVNLTQQCGAPESVQYRRPATREQPHAARWQDGAMVFEVEARPDYGTVAMRWTQRSTFDQLAELRGGVKPPALANDDELDPTIMDIMKD